MELPSSRAREIDLVLGPELEDHLPFSDLDEVVYDYRILEPTETGGSKLLVAVVQREFLRGFIETLKDAGVEPRVVTVAGLSKADLLREMAVIEDGPPDGEDLTASKGEVTLSGADLRLGKGAIPLPKGSMFPQFDLESPTDLGSLELELKPAAAFVKRNSLGLIVNNPRLKRHQKDGWFGVRLGGTVSTPQPRLQRPGSGRKAKPGRKGRKGRKGKKGKKGKGRAPRLRAGELDGSGLRP